jgi:hypothetical protein
MRGIFGRSNKMGEIGGEIGQSRKKGGLLKTGQTTQYGGYLDDGYYEKGLSKSYSILTGGQYAGTTSITLNAKTDVHSNNCVYDRRTKLMWSRYVPASIGPASDGKLPWTTNVNGEGIFPFVAAANAALLGGYSDWRIPNLLELLSVADYEAPTAAPDLTAFPDLPTTDYFNTSTTYPTNTTAFFAIYFAPGSFVGQGKTTPFFLALVRGG